MKFFITEINDETVTVRIRAESEDGNLIGDSVLDVRPDFRLFGLSFEELSGLGLGEHEVEENQK